MGDVMPSILDRIACAENFSEAAKGLVDWARELTGCEAAMLRFREDDDEQGTWIPALFDQGLGERFLRDEILIGSEECLCGCVCDGRVPTTFPFFTEAGSFCWGRFQTIAEDFSLESLQKVRGRCILEGFESVAILPLGGYGALESTEVPTASGSQERADGTATPVGCLHLADHERDTIAPHLETLESVCRAAGPLLARFPAKERTAYLIGAIEAALAPATVSYVSTLDLAVCFTSATEAAHLGGDFYDVIEFDDGEVLLLVGDYCGKGIAAAGMAARARQAITGLVRREQTPAELLETADTVLHDLLPEDKFVTLAACRYSPGGKLECALAGHPYPLVLEGEGWLDELALPTNLPLGCGIGNGRFREGEARLKESQTLVLYTDGITESRREGHLFGLEGIAEVWRRMGRCTLKELTATLCFTSAEFHAAEFPSDDRLVLAARAPSPQYPEELA
jgi:hypothetical protein